MKFVITTLILLISQVSFGQEIRTEVKKIIGKIAKENMYKSAVVGFGGQRTTQWENFEKLKEKTTDEELIILTEHKYPVVRCYSFQALAERNHYKTYDILLKHLTDNDRVKTIRGCIASSQSVGDFFHNIVTKNYRSITSYKLHAKQKHHLDSILLFDKHVKLSAKISLLDTINPKEEYYERIKEIYNENNILTAPTALIAISKYKKEEDIELIIQWLEKKDTDNQYYGLRAVKNFPNSKFFPYIEKIQKQEIKKLTGFNYSLIRALYLAVVQYKNKESRVLIENTLDNTTSSTLEYHSEHIWLALTKYPAPVYKGLKKRIKLSNWQKENMKDWLDYLD